MSFTGSVVDFELLIPAKWFAIFMKRFSVDSKYERSLFSVTVEILSSSLFWCSGRVEISDSEVRLSLRKAVLTCSMLPTISCVSGTNTVSSPTESALTVMYATSPLK